MILRLRDRFPLAYAATRVAFVVTTSVVLGLMIVGLGVFGFFAFRTIPPMFMHHVAEAAAPWFLPGAPIYVRRTFCISRDREVEVSFEIRRQNGEPVVPFQQPQRWYFSRAESPATSFSPQGAGCWERALFRIPLSRDLRLEPGHYVLTVQTKVIGDPARLERDTYETSPDIPFMVVLR